MVRKVETERRALDLNEIIANTPVDGPYRILLIVGRATGMRRGELCGLRWEHVDLDNAEITAAEMRGRTAQLTVRFQSKLVSVTRDKDGNAIAGQTKSIRIRFER